MLTERQTEQKLKEYAQRFTQHVRNKEWGKAHNIYNMALTVAVFMDSSEELLAELFGPYDVPGSEHMGLFRQSEVSRVNTECCIRRNIAYEDIACRKIGMPVRYYSEETYCAGCRKAKR